MKRSFTRPTQHEAFWMTVGILAIAPQQVPATSTAKMDVLIKPISIALPFGLKTKNPLDLNDSFAQFKNKDARRSHRCITHLESSATSRWTGLPNWEGQAVLPVGRAHNRQNGRVNGRTMNPVQAGHPHSRWIPAPQCFLGPVSDASEPHHSGPMSPFPPCGHAPHMHTPPHRYPTCTSTGAHCRPLPASQAAA